MAAFAAPLLDILAGLAGVTARRVLLVPHATCAVILPRFGTGPQSQNVGTSRVMVTARLVLLVPLVTNAAILRRIGTDRPLQNVETSLVGARKQFAH